MESDKKQLKKEENEKREKEIEQKLKEVETKFLEIKLKKDNFKDNFLSQIKIVLSFNTKKIKNEKLLEDIYLLTAKMIEVALVEKELINFQDLLTDDEKCELNKFFYQTYDRTCKKQNCLTLKPAKIYNLQLATINSSGPGIVSRALFSIQK